MGDKERIKKGVHLKEFGFQSAAKDSRGYQSGVGQDNQTPPVVDSSVQSNDKPDNKPDNSEKPK